MDKAEAIERLECLKAKAQLVLEQEVPEWIAEDVLSTIEAYDMAIEALQTEPNSSEKPNNSTVSKMEQVDKDINVRSKDEPKTQMKTQNSNLTFKTLEYCDICDHKGCEECIANALDEHCMPSQFKKQIEDECAKEYEELGLKELKELIEADRKDESLTEGVWNAGYKTGYDKGYKDAQKVKDSQDLVKDLVKAFCEDGTWLERQGVYTLTLAEAKQRAVDIIESVIAKDKPTTQTETQNSNLTFEKADEPQTDCPWK